MDANKQLQILEAGIENFCLSHIPQTNIVKKPRGKIIHDTTWKTNYFEPHEIDVIHTPLFQRLRHISQMGFVDYVYPAARHSRFEHSLGVAVLAGRMVDAVRKKNNEYINNLLNENTRRSVRMSALLHDVGHCLYSHTSELVYGKDLDALISLKFPDKKAKPSYHEFLSYLIVTSKAVRTYLNKLNNMYLLSMDADEIAMRIIGRIKDDKETERYATSFISGPLDADKLDYFHRDSQFSGIPTQLDIDRLFHELDIPLMGEGENTVRDLTVSDAGINCIEQLIFNKMTLYSTIYTHHKVEAIDCMFKGIFEYINEKNIELKINGTLKQINTVVDYLYLVDYNLFALADETDDDNLKRLINNIRERKLLKRAFAMNRNTIPANKTMAEIIKLLMPDKVNLRDLAKRIWEEAKVYCLPQEVWIDFPRSPISKETQNILVRPRGPKEKEFKAIEKYYPLSQYKTLYENNRLNGHVFAPEDCVDRVAKAARKVLEAELGVEFNAAADVSLKH